MNLRIPSPDAQTLALTTYDGMLRRDGLPVEVVEIRLDRWDKAQALYGLTNAEMRVFRRDCSRPGNTYALTAEAIIAARKDVA